MSQISIRNIFFRRSFGWVAAFAASVVLSGSLGCQSLNKCANCGASNNPFATMRGGDPEDEDGDKPIAAPVAPNEKTTAGTQTPFDGTGNWDDDGASVALAPTEGFGLGTGDFGTGDQTVASSNLNAAAPGKKLVGNTGKVDETTSASKPIASSSAETTQTSPTAENAQTVESETTQTPQNAENAPGVFDETQENNADVPSDDVDDEDKYVRSTARASLKTASLKSSRNASFDGTNRRSSGVRSIPKTVAFKAETSTVAVVEIPAQPRRAATTPSVRRGSIDASTRSFPIGDPRLESRKSDLAPVSATAFGNASAFDFVQTEGRRR